ncbi:MAG TPA: ABC transporter substrate-binding protein [Thermomonospora sp.]|nr:ABC transporter substrate-binding protein [Thermomonospora sp.]
MAKLVTGAATLAVVVGLAGCGARGPDEADPLGRPGGVLRVVGEADVEHLDPATAHGPHAYALGRLFARTLFATSASNNFDETLPVRADLAASVPTKENGGISKDGRTYTIRLRKGVRWGTDPVRPVVAKDVVRGFERLCNPAAPSPYRTHYIATIRGMAEFCRGFAHVDDDDAEAIAEYQDEHSISGIEAEGEDRLVFRLRRPAPDFLALLTLPSAAAAPEEYDRYVPDDRRLRQNTISNGPYRIARYRPGRSYVFEHNPAWDAASDPLRGRFADRIEITLGVGSAEEVARRIERGEADLSWDRPVPAAVVERLRGREGLALRPVPGRGPYLVLGGRGALARREVRQALQYAVDRTAVIRILGGPEVARPQHTVIAPGNHGYFEHNAYPTPGDAGDPGRCRDLLGGTRLNLTLIHENDHQSERIAEVLKDNLGDCGVKVRLTRKGSHDAALVSVRPEWFGGNGRSALLPLLEEAANPLVEPLVEDALTAPDAARATGLWNQVDRLLMQEAAIVPLADAALPVQHSARVRDARFVPAARTYDFTRLWLAGERE